MIFTSIAVSTMSMRTRAADGTEAEAIEAAVDVNLRYMIIIKLLFIICIQCCNYINKKPQNHLLQM